MEAVSPAAFEIDPRTTIGAVALTVSDLARSLAYYQGGIGLGLLEREGETAVLGAGNTTLLKLQEEPGAQLMRRATGLYHFALRVPNRRDLARVVRHLTETETALDGASDHLVSEALYLSDPDGHGIEIYRDRERDAWYDESGQVKMDTKRLDFESLMAELAGDAQLWKGLPSDTVMGHVHLQVADIPAAQQFYLNILGFGHILSMPTASFISAGGYHHHIGMNVWAGVGIPAPPEDAARLIYYEILLPDAAAVATVLEQVQVADIEMREQFEGWVVRDPSHIEILLRTAPG